MSTLSARVIGALAVLLVCACVLATTSASAAKMTYRIRDLGIPPGAEISDAAAINNNGQVVGSVAFPNPDREALVMSWHPFLWQDGKMMDLGLPNGVTALRGRDINDEGQIVAELFGRCFIWTNGKYEEIRGPAGAKNWMVSAINNKGQIAGSYLESGSNPAKTFIRYKGHSTVLSAFRLCSGYSDSVWVTGMNNRGQVVASAEMYHQAWLWTGSRMRTLHSRGSGYISLSGINDDGWVIGECYGRYRPHPFLWRNGKTLRLKMPPGLSKCTVNAINSKGQVVGEGTDKQGRCCAFLWQNGVSQALPPLTPRADCHAVDINDRAIISGNARDAQGKTHAVIWEPMRK